MHSHAEANLAQAASRADARVFQSDPLARGVVGALLRLLMAATLAGVPRVCWSQSESEQQATGLDPVLVQGNYDQGIGSTESASSGAVTSLLIKNRPTLRPAEVLEFIPGMIVTQHSGEGKANQYFLRGFNLDHGTDFASFVDGMPVNMPSHAHGQGYTDLNWLIPELVSRISYRKGPYFAEEGDFASVGSARIGLVDTLPSGIASISVGQGGYLRALLARSVALANGNLLYALEAGRNNGPWESPDRLRRLNGVLRWSEGDAQHRQSITAMAYSSKWQATDQIPQRAVDAGLISRFGYIDSTDGGTTQRFSLSYALERRNTHGATQFNAFAIQSRFDLSSNFTYWLDDPINGDQFQQSERRKVLGANLKHSLNTPFAGHSSITTFGVQLRRDRLDPVGLYTSSAGSRTSVLQESQVSQISAAAFAENLTQWTGWLNSVLGLRADRVAFDVSSSIPQNSGKAQAALVSPKVSVIFGPWARTEFFANYGSGFHSNDARGAVASVSPRELIPIESVRPLVRSRGAELGARTEAIRGLQSSLAVWQLNLDSELVFVGDAGDTAPSRASRRTGIEWNNHYIARPWLLIDADLAMSRARYTEPDPSGQFIPGSIGTVVSLGVSLIDLGRWSGQFQVRHFGPRPLTEDNTQRSESTTLANLRIGYALRPDFRIALDVFNLFDRKASDIDYYYTSRLPGEPAAGIGDRHFHPVVPRTLRLTATATF
jgi:outer membrane receptor protein involved in Fe transport